MSEILIRRFQPGEGDALGALFHRAVHEGAAGAYDAAQRAAWSPEPPQGPEWAARLGAAATLVAWDGSTPAGFMSLDLETGYLDMAYVSPGYRGRGVADMLYGVLERSARRRGLRRMSSDASELARGFLIKQGWDDGPRQEVQRRGVTLHNYRMAKRLKPGLETAA